MSNSSKHIRRRFALRFAWIAVLFVLASAGPAAHAQETGRFSTVVKVTYFPEVGVKLHFTDRLSVRALAGLQTDFEGSTGGIGNLSLLYRLGTVSPRLTDYVGAGITTLGFDSDLLFFGVLYGARYQLTEQLGLFGEVGLDVGDGPVFSIINNTGIGMSYRF